MIERESPLSSYQQAKYGPQTGCSAEGCQGRGTGALLSAEKKAAFTLHF